MLLIFADVTITDTQIDWTAVIKTFGTVAGIVIAGLGGWYLKILSAKQAHEIEKSKQEAAIRAEERAEAEKVRVREEEREARVERQREIADAKKERSTSRELKDLLEISQKQHAEDREQIHELRNKINIITQQMLLCEAHREAQERQLAEQAQQLHTLFTHLGMKYERKQTIVSLDDIQRLAKKSENRGEQPNPPEENDDGTG